jgi:hypothetical protein
MNREFFAAASLQGCRPRARRVRWFQWRNVVSKSPYRIEDFLPAPRRVPRVNMIAVLALLGLVLLPILIELVSLWVAGWFKVMKIVLVVQTPVIDFSRAVIAMCCEEFANWAADLFREVNWSPSSILPIVALLLVVAARMLKK